MKRKFTRSENMSRIKSKDTKIELVLRKALWHRGFRYRKNDKTVYGKPDIVFKSKKIAIFCDSEFWHGYEYLHEGKTFKSNASFWEEKMKRNITRDEQVNIKLKESGWMVLRFWQREIEKDLVKCVDTIEKALQEKK